MLSKERLEQLYEDGLSQEQIGKIIGVTSGTISYWMKKYGIRARSLSESSPHIITLSPEQGELINNLYRSGFSILEISAKIGLSFHIVRKTISQTRSISQANRIRTQKNKHDLSEHQIQLILGTLLGDGCLLSRNGSFTLQMAHGKEQKEYIRHKASQLGVEIKRRKYGKKAFSSGKKFFTANYTNKGALQPISDLVLIDGKKRVNEAWIGALTKIGIAYWFMDDGSSSFTTKKKSSAYVIFHSCSFSEHENSILVQKLRSFGIMANIIGKNSKAGRLSIYIPTSSTQRLFRLVKPMVWQVPCMRYKLKLI